MKIIHSIKELNIELKYLSDENKSIGFVPTMGYLHDGHLSLIKEARKNCDIVVVSIFVNPTQFGPSEDLDKYPRNIDRDLNLISEINANLVFIPSAEEIYPQGYNTYVEVFGGITEKMCGASRPGHFRGVTTVVMKLFNIVKPDKAYFGQKDAQQLLVIKKMVLDLNMDISIISCPIVRETDGLAMSSRNVYLTKEQREYAPIIYKSLQQAKRTIQSGENDLNVIKEKIINNLKSCPILEIDYVFIADSQTLEEVNYFRNKEILIAIAAKFGNTRLIDNILVN